MASMLQSLGPHLEDVASDRAALRRIEQGGVDLVVGGVDPFDPEALELLQYVRRKHPKLPVILLFTVNHPERSREALQRGAATVLRFPLPATQLRAAVSQALGRPEVPCATPPAPPRITIPAGDLAAIAARDTQGWTVLEGHSNHTVCVAEPKPRLPKTDAPLLVGEDGSLRQAIELAETIAATRAAVLIEGERGTGKSLVAQALHSQSPRHRGPFFEINCSSQREAILEVELFGRRSVGLGSAMPDQPGKIALASGGTLYMDEVSALSPDLQLKLLRVLQENEYEPVGSTQTVRADVRFVFGNREDLSERVARDEFRQDLFYRISVVCLKLPPLRHRGSDIERLADHFRLRVCARLGREVNGCSPDAIESLRHYDWPGNVQELENCIERAVTNARGPLISAADLGLPAPKAAVVGDPIIVGRTNGASNGRRSHSPGIRPLKEALEEPEKRIILQALEALNWNRQETARLLDINRTTLYKKMKKYGLLLDEPAWVN
jgi:DNA-binding NtrC family response regulator